MSDKDNLEGDGDTSRAAESWLKIHHASLRDDRAGSTTDMISDSDGLFEHTRSSPAKKRKAFIWDFLRNYIVDDVGFESEKSLKRRSLDFLQRFDEAKDSMIRRSRHRVRRAVIYGTISLDEVNNVIDEMLADKRVFDGQSRERLFTLRSYAITLKGDSGPNEGDSQN